MTLIIKLEGRQCPHNMVVMIQKDREVRCQFCEALVDPFDHLLYLATLEENTRTMRYELAEECKKLREEKERLQKDVRNLDAKIQRRCGK